MAFLDPNYKKPASNNRYMRFITGDNKFRVLGSAITGWIDWMEVDGARKPIRTIEKPEKSINPARPAKHFWAFPVWDYRDKMVKILEITQSGIQDAIFSLHQDANWGDPMNYDINIKRVGEDLNTKYTVVPSPPQPTHPEILKIYQNTKINLKALYSNDDPFADNQNTPPAETPATPVYTPTFSGPANNQFTATEPEIDVDNLPF